MLAFDVGIREGRKGLGVSGSSVLDFVSEGFERVVRILLCERTLFTVVHGFLVGFLMVVCSGC